MTKPLDAFRDATAPNPEEVARVLARARTDHLSRTRKPGRTPRLALLLVLGGSATAWAAGLVPGLVPPWRVLDAPRTTLTQTRRADTTVPPRPAPVDAPHASQETTGSVLVAESSEAGTTANALPTPPAPPPDAPTDAPETHRAFSGAVDLDLAGGGHVRGEGVGTILQDGIALGSGRVSVRGARRIETREAEITPGAAPVVVGRDALGTTTDVGTARVQCRGEAEVQDARHTCLPVSAEGLLARAATLRRTGDTEGEHRAIDLALRAAATPMVRAEVLYQRATRPGVDPDEAIADLEAALATGATARPDDLDRALARLLARQGRCAAALPHLRSLEARGALAEDVVLLTRCATAP
jgi:hypothetical protein